MSNRKLVPRPNRLTRWLFIENFGVLQLTDTWHQWQHLNELLPLFTRKKYEYYRVVNGIKVSTGTGHWITDHYILTDIYGAELPVINKLIRHRTRDERIDDYYRSSRLLPPLLWLPIKQR